MSQYNHSTSLLHLLVAFVAGSLFGFGLIIAQMIDANKVLNFLDVFGQWDPSLAIVMGAGLSVFSVGYLFFVKPKSKPLLDDHFFYRPKHILIKNYYSAHAYLA
ncbi:DUF6691 family protein [Shewanella sp. HL-SH4]|uniref:DUF6691 family protein n=1 Tax=Shewanella sp. HL-SH4 TaxID=3436240 RepID=UPI003EBA78CD